MCVRVIFVRSEVVLWNKFPLSSSSHILLKTDTSYIRTCIRHHCWFSSGIFCMANVSFISLHRLTFTTLIRHVSNGCWMLRFFLEIIMVIVVHIWYVWQEWHVWQVRQVWQFSTGVAHLMCVVNLTGVALCNRCGTMSWCTAIWLNLMQKQITEWKTLFNHF